MANSPAKKFVIAALAFVALGGMDRLFANVIIAIDQTGANDPVSSISPRTWNFGITSVGAAYFSANGMTFDRALFDAKIHHGATAPLVFTLYSGLGGAQSGNTVLATVSEPASAFNNQYGGTDARWFTFTGLDLSAGYYSVTLTSTAAANPNSEYFVKEGALVLQNSDGTTLASSYWLQDLGRGNAAAVFNGTGSIDAASTLVPEPNTAWAILLFAGFSLGGMLLPRFQRKSLLAVAR